MSAYKRYDRIDPKTTSVEWYTPESIFARLGLEFALDVCAPPGGLPWIPAKRSFSRDEDGLAQPWTGVVWMNPPYGREIGKWMGKLAVHGDGMALVFTRSDTAWWQEAIRQADAVCFIRGRLRFIRGSDRTQPPGVSPAPSVLFAYGPTCTRALLKANLGPTLLVPHRVREAA
jgi:DNA N-6-adenine-methyltransferase (Dam)